MLVLSRKIGEIIRVGSDVELVVLEVKAGKVKLGIAAPRGVQVRRGELPAATEFGDVAGAILAKPVSTTLAEGRPAFAPATAFQTATSGV
jgi:carbon storage regulator